MHSYDRRATTEETSTTEEVSVQRRQRRQKGLAKLKSRQRYRKNRAKIKRRSQQYRRTHKSKIKRYRRKVKRNPMMHKRRRADVQDVDISLQDVEFWDAQSNQLGVIDGIDLDQSQVQTTVGDEGKEKSYDFYSFLDTVVLPFEDDEERFFKVLDDLHKDAPEDDEDDEVKTAYSYDRR